MDKKTALSYISSFSTILISGIFLLLPVFFLTSTTDFFTFPKQILIVFGALALFILWALKSVIDGKISLLLNPLNIPVFLFAVFVLVSAAVSPNRYDSILQAAPVALAALLYFTVINFINEKQSFTIALSSLIIGGVLSSLISILSQFKIYILPFALTQSQSFNTQGAPIQEILFLLPLAVFCVVFILQVAKSGAFSKITKNYSEVIQVASALIIVGGIAVIGYQIFSSPQKPILLPFNDGFQIAFAAISQDSERLLAATLLGSGYGTFSTDFTRFVSATFNSNPSWNLIFSFSSSYLFELIATTGLLGLGAFLFMIFQFIRTRRSMSNPLFLSVATVFVLSLVLPFSFSIVFLLFALLALYVAHLNIDKSKKVSEVDVNLAVFSRSMFTINDKPALGFMQDSRFPLLPMFRVLPLIVLIFSGLVTIYVLFFLSWGGNASPKGYVQLISSDMDFAKSITPQSLRAGTTLALQAKAIDQYPYRSDYYRYFSQINLQLAGNLVASQQGNAKPSAEVQQQVLNLLQQSINTARQAVTLSRTVSLNWLNLAQIYRNLIGVGQNAEQFTIASLNQAILLNPANPALYIELGGVYYQLQKYDLAQNQFQIAVEKKPDYANAHYNLGKAMEQKGDLQGALQEYGAVKQLVANDKQNLEKINAEIKNLQDKIGAQAKTTEKTGAPTQDTTPLTVNKPAAEFPAQNPKVKLPEPPPVTPTATPATSPTPSAAVTPTPAQ